MASTFWPESYFRSLNQSKVLNQLTKYLLQYRRVSIPSVGTISLAPQPAQLNVADKVILPPSFTAVIKSDVQVSDHQLTFLSVSLQEEKSRVLQSLHELGRELQTQVQNEGFQWKGIGLIRNGNDTLQVPLPQLAPVPAERILRQDAEHNVLVGDRQMTSTQIAEQKEEGEVRKEKGVSIYMIIGWILFILSALFIIYILYQGKFRMGSTGSKRAPTSLQYSPYNVKETLYHL